MFLLVKASIKLMSSSIFGVIARPINKPIRVPKIPMIKPRLIKIKV